MHTGRRDQEQRRRGPAVQAVHAALQRGAAAGGLYWTPGRSSSLGYTRNVLSSLLGGALPGCSRAWAIHAPCAHHCCKVLCISSLQPTDTYAYVLAIPCTTKQVQTAAGTHTYIEVPSFDPAWDNLWLEAKLPWPMGLLLTPRHLDRCGWGAAVWLAPAHTSERRGVKCPCGLITAVADVSAATPRAARPSAAAGTVHCSSCTHP